MNRILLSLGAIAALAMALIGCEAGTTNDNTAESNNDTGNTAESTNESASETNESTNESASETNTNGNDASTTDRDGLVAISLNVKGMT